MKEKHPDYETLFVFNRESTMEWFKLLYRTSPMGSAPGPFKPPRIHHIRMEVHSKIRAASGDGPAIIERHFKSLSMMAEWILTFGFQDNQCETSLAGKYPEMKGVKFFKITVERPFWLDEAVPKVRGTI